MTHAMPVLTAVLFDMDGVLIDSNLVIEKAWREAGKLYNRDISDADIARHIHGQPGPHTIHALFNDLSLQDQAFVQQYIIDAENNADYEPIKGVAEFITALHHAGITIGIVTSGWRKKIDRVIHMLGADDAISTVVERDDVERGKPWPDPYLLAATRLGITPDKALVFEDSHSGITSAVSAGTYCVGVGSEALQNGGPECAVIDFSHLQWHTDEAGQFILSLRPGNTIMLIPA